MKEFLTTLLLTWALTSHDISCDVTVPVNNHWNGGFQAKVCFDITENMNQWTITLHFDQPITSLEAFTADAHAGADNKEWTLTNKAFNGVEHVGDTLCQEFQGHGNGDVTPVITATLNGVTGGGGVVQHTTHAVVHTNPHTNPQHTQPTASLAPGETHPPTTLVVPVVAGGGIPGTMTITQDWGDRFEGSFSFHVTEDIEGWMANITFSKAVNQMDIQVGQPYSHSSDGLNWIVVNKQDRPFYKAGDTIEMRFFGNYGGSHGANDHAPTGTAVLYNLGSDKNSTLSCACEPSSATSKYNYDCLLKDSILFYTIQRSGKLPANNRIGWRGDSALNDRGDNGEDLTGGWYDAGDHVKFNFPMSYSTVVLNWGYLRYKDAYDAAGQADWLLDCVKWPLDYLLKCYIPNDVSDPDDDVLYVQVGDGGSDHSYWGRPEEMTVARPAYKVDAAHPGCDVAMETAAAFASGAMVFNATDKAYSDTLLEKAKLLWKFAVGHLGKYSDSISAAKAYYPAYNFTDEMCWGSMWLYKATGDQQYLEEAKKWFDHDPDWGMSWDDKVVGCQLMLYEATGEDIYKQAVIGTMTYWLPGGTIQYTPKGLAWRLQWAPLRYSSNMAMMALFAADDGLNAESYRHWAMCQIHYALGDTGFSFVVGFGDQGYPLRAHHRGGSCPIPPAPCGPQIMSSNAPNVHTLCGALVGGPDSNDAYKDERSNYVMNEVACDYNAGFQTAVAGLRSLLVHNLHHEQTGNAQCPYS